MSIDELNQIAVSQEMDEFIRVCEAAQRKRLSRIADEICSRPDVRIVLLAGGSSAGKTTTSKRLCTQLRVNDARAVYFSTDDYFVGDSRNPRDENGEFDYEHVEAVDIARLVSDLNALIRGEKVHLRKFDFLTHEGYDDEKTTEIDGRTYVVIEGLHALNPRLTEGVEERRKYRIFIEPSTQPEVFAATRLPQTDARLLRRIVRDNRFRKVDPSLTFARWPKVLAGEEKWILPFRGEADAEFDSALRYELCVLKPFVQGLLESVIRKDPSNRLAAGLMELLKYVQPVSPFAVPGDSILRETIGSSQLEY